MATARRSSSRSAPARRSEPAGSSGYRGAAGLSKMRQVHEQEEIQREMRRDQVGMPFRFYMKAGDTRQYIIVDDAPDFFRWEHNLQNPNGGKWDIFTSCIAENANCPVCKSTSRKAYYAMYLTVIDLQEYEDRNGNLVEWSKKLLVVKSAQQKKFVRMFEREGSLRGALIEARRDGDMDASIGGDIELVEWVEEDELETYVSEYTDQNNQTHEVIGYEPFDYDALFPAQTEQQLRAIAGGKAEPGSRDDDYGDRDDRGSARGRAGARAGAGRRTRGEDAQDVEYTEQPRRAGRRSEPEDPPAETRGRRTRSAPAEPQDDAPPPRRAGRRSEPAYEEGDAQDDPPAETRGRATTRRAVPPADDPPQRTAARRTTRQAEPPDEDTPAGDEPPRRGSMATRRAQLRRG